MNVLCRPVECAAIVHFRNYVELSFSVGRKNDSSENEVIAAGLFIGRSAEKVS